MANKKKGARKPKEVSLIEKLKPESFGEFASMCRLRFSREHDPDLAVFLEARVSIVGVGCWEWRGSFVGKRYAQARYGGKQTLVHRLAYLCTHGELPPAPSVIRHTCDNSHCVNPAHLLVGTQTDNMADMYSRGRHNPPKGERNCRAVLSEDDVLAIRRSGYRRDEIAKRYGISYSQVCRIKTGEAWKHIGFKP